MIPSLCKVSPQRRRKTKTKVNFKSVFTTEKLRATLKVQFSIRSFLNSYLRSGNEWDNEWDNPELAAGSLLLYLCWSLVDCSSTNLPSFFCCIIHVALQSVGQFIINLGSFDLEILYGFFNVCDTSDCMCCLVYRRGERII